VSLPDGAEYWWREPQTHSKRVFVHARGLECGHFHVVESKYTDDIDCHACKKIIAETDLDLGLTPGHRPPPKPKKPKQKPLKVGERVSHEDYSSELFTVSEIDGRVITTKGGKNGIWINDVALIIRNPVKINGSYENSKRLSK